MRYHTITGMISTIMAKYHEIIRLAAAQNNHASTLCVTKRRWSVGCFLYQKKWIRIAGATSTAARNVDPMSVEKRRVAILGEV
jgi:hypothetical protein